MQFTCRGPISVSGHRLKESLSLSSPKATLFFPFSLVSCPPWPGPCPAHPLLQPGQVMARPSSSDPVPLGHRASWLLRAQQPPPVSLVLPGFFLCLLPPRARTPAIPASESASIPL